MSISLDGVTSYGAASSQATAQAAKQTGALGQETFMTLLVTQLQNQDPLNPQSNEEFVAQLAQFSSLEQLVSLGESMDAMYMATASMNNASMTQLLGRDVVAWSDEFNYDGEGDVTLHYDAASEASSATITISDADGKVVWSGSMGELESGEGEFVWDGRDSSGQTVDAGVYTFSIDAVDANGDEVEVLGQIHGEIDGMSYEDGAPAPSIGGVDIALGDILRVGSADEADSAGDGSSGGKDKKEESVESYGNSNENGE